MPSHGFRCNIQPAWDFQPREVCPRILVPLMAGLSQGTRPLHADVGFNQRESILTKIFGLLLLHKGPFGGHNTTEPSLDSEFGDYFTLFEGICPFLKRRGSVQFCSSDMKIIADVQMQTLISSFLGPSSTCCHLNCVKMRPCQKMRQFATPLLEPKQ